VVESSTDFCKLSVGENVAGRCDRHAPTRDSKEFFVTVIVDGYNVLHASGVFGKGRGTRGFEESRTALLDLMVDLLGRETSNVIVVFDAAEAPDGLPSRLAHRGLRVWFAREYPDADSLIEELVASDTSPLQLVVVSSDRRLAAAARRRRATCIESDVWLNDLRKRSRENPLLAIQYDAKPCAPATSQEVQRWLDEFNIPSSASDSWRVIETSSIPPADTATHKTDVSVPLPNHIRNKKPKQKSPRNTGKPPDLPQGDLFPPEFIDGIDDLDSKDSSPAFE